MLNQLEQKVFDFLTANKVRPEVALGLVEKRKINEAEDGQSFMVGIISRPRLLWSQPSLSNLR